MWQLIFKVQISLCKAFINFFHPCLVVTSSDIQLITLTVFSYGDFLKRHTILSARPREPLRASCKLAVGWLFFLTTPEANLWWNTELQIPFSLIVYQTDCWGVGNLSTVFG